MQNLKNKLVGVAVAATVLAVNAHAALPTEISDLQTNADTVKTWGVGLAIAVALTGVVIGYLRRGSKGRL